MATWSLVSQSTLPLYRRLLASYRDRGLVVVSIAMDAETPLLVDTYVRSLAIDWPVALATSEVLEGRSPLGSLPEIPRLFILDRRGFVRFAHDGHVTPALLAREVESLL
jgi:hypothetical protein